MKQFKRMNGKGLTSQLITAIALFGLVQSSHAHDAAATMDPVGNSATFTGYGFVTCFDDGNGPADKLLASVNDLSPPVPGLLVNLQILKGNRAASVTDPVSGDGNGSPVIAVRGGNGVYQIMINKTAVGARNFSIQYHCMTANDVHTGTDIGV
mgnify:FL=1